MKRMIPLSAIVSGLLASQGFVAPSFAAPVRRGDDGAIVAPEQAVSAEKAARLQAELVQMIEKGPEDVGGMRAMQRAVAAEMREHMNNLLAAGDLPGTRRQDLDLIADRDLIAERMEKG